MSNGSERAFKAWHTRKWKAAREKSVIAEAASEEALREYCRKHTWRVAFFEGETGSPRTGIIDAIVFRISKKNADVLDLRLVQLKGGRAGISAREIARLRKASDDVDMKWLIAAYDGQTLHLLPADLEA